MTYYDRQDKYIEGNARIPSGCAISGYFSKKGERIPGDRIVQSLSLIHI